MAVTDQYQHSYRGKKENKNAVASTDGKGHEIKYRPTGKDEREARRRVWDRYNKMKDSAGRQEAMKRWDLGDKQYRMWQPEINPDDWRADIVLPDGFSAVQTHMQETIGLRARPKLEGVESSDETLEYFVDHIFQYAMDKTEFDIETNKAKYCAAIRGDGFTREEWRCDKRMVKDPVSVDDETGELKYKEREIIDFEDVYTRWIDNSATFIDDSVDDYKYAEDWVYREVIPYDVFKDTYGGMAGYKNIDMVLPAGSISKKAGFFQKTDDMNDDDVELLHYENKRTDSYDVLANNVMVRETPLPSKHKQLSLDKWTFYPIPGEVWGMGIPFIIYTLVEERRTNRNLSVDRNKMALSKMFLANDLFDIDEDDLTPRPHGVVKVNTNGIPLNQALVPLEYSDVPASSLRLDDTLLMDQRRAHGLDDRPAQTQGGTATENAIISEAAQKRINLVNTMQNWTTLKSIGRKKWSNIQFFYPAGRTEEVMVENEWKKKKVYKTIKFQGKRVAIQGDPTKGGAEARIWVNPFDTGSTTVSLDPTYARFMEGNYDIIMNAESHVMESPATKFARISEFNVGVSSNPLFSPHMDGQKTLTRMYQLAGENPKDYMRGGGATEVDMKEQAELENGLVLQMGDTGNIFVMPPTPNATMEHTESHLDFTKTAEFEALPQEIQDIMTNHIMGEHDQNPETGSAAEAIAGAEGSMEQAQDGPMPPTGGDVVPPGAPGGPAVPDMMASDGAPVVGGDVTEGNVA